MDTLKTELRFGNEAQQSLLSGVEKLARAVRGTMGPGGKNVVIEQPNGRPILTKDGVTVAKAINLFDRNENLGAQLVKEAASGAAEIAGDGTTTATVLAYELFRIGIRMIHAGQNPVELRKQLRMWSSNLEDELLSKSVPVKTDKQILQVGTLSANGEEEVGQFIVDAMNTVGRDGVITVEDAKGFKSYLEKVDGTRLNRGFVSPYFITDQGRSVCVLDKPVILLLRSHLSNLQEILPVLEKAHMASRQLLIVANDIDGEALNGLVVNKMKGNLKVCAIRCPEFGQGRTQTMNDLSILLNTKVFAVTDAELKTITVNDLGSAGKITVARNETVVLSPGGDKTQVEERSKEIRDHLNSPGLDAQEIALAQRRLAKLAGGIAIIRVGGATEAELRERRDRIDDALHATRAAVTGGYLPGGGTALVKCVSEISKKQTQISPGLQLLIEACEKPLKQIAENAGITGELVFEKVNEQKDFRNGFNARTKTYEDLIESGVIDPTLVVTSALRHAVSAADNLLSVSCCVTIPEE